MQVGPANSVTHASLLSRVRDPADVAAWREFETRYRDLLLRFGRRRGLQQADAEDIAQVVLSNLSKSLRGFRYDPKRGRFRDYLFRCARNAIAQWASRPKHAQLALGTDGGTDPLDAASGADDAEMAAAWEKEWIAHHYRLAMDEVGRTFEARSVEIFEASLAGKSVAELAAASGISEQAVHKVRQRIKARLEECIARQVAEEDQAGG